VTLALARRAATIRALESGAYDVLVVGGGITGAGIARDAALRGLRTALLERDDFASGTSSRSSRLIHGGVRYLEHGYLHLVFESSRERRILLRVARHLVQPLAFTWPVYRGSRISRSRLFAGLALYDALSLFRNVAPHARLTAAGVRRAEPAIRSKDLLGGARYFDAATDDARLTLANALGAADAGAAVLNQAAVVDLTRAGGRATGAIVEDRLAQRRFSVHARTIVNATGAESRAFQSLESGRPAAAPVVSKGAHIAVPRARAGNRDAVTMLHPIDHRVLFAIPAGDRTIVSTTESTGVIDVRTPHASREDIAYLLAAANSYFPDAVLGERDVVAAWAGIRPLAVDLAVGDAGSASREHEITVGAAGVVSVTGGKLTTYRSMAEEVVDGIVSRWGRPHVQRCRTASVPLTGADFDALSELWFAARAAGLAPALGERLVRAHGTRWPAVWSYACTTPTLAEPVRADLPYLGAELVYAVEREMAFTLGDALIRRTHAAFESSDHAISAAPHAARVLGPYLNWDAARQREEVRAYVQEVDRMFGNRE
jgi:glycerol-3-phosphate dehydrogenase